MPRKRIEEANAFLEAGNNEEALRLAHKELDDNPDDMRALFISGRAMLNMNRPGAAFPVCKRFVDLYPNLPQGWDNMGQAFQDTWDLKSAEECFLTGLRIDPRNFSILNNLCHNYVWQNRPKLAIEMADRAMRLNGDGVSPLFNKSLAYLMGGDFENGWDYYDAALGKKGSDRKEFCYRNPGERWDGTPGLNVVAYGEQGLGDEILFASCIPDLIRDCSVTLDCHKKLENLFARSFNCRVYGTRNDTSPEWVQAAKIDASIAIGSLPRFYRRKREDFPGKPYLKAHPQKRRAWRAVLDTYPGRKIGIAWTAGLQKTAQKLRSIPVDALQPLLETGDTFISLEYKEHEDIPGILNMYHWINTGDYDDTAALVAELDFVIAPTTAIVDLCGALGVKCHVLVNDKPMWRYHGENPWYQSIQLFRQLNGEPWQKTVLRLAKSL